MNPHIAAATLPDKSSDIPDNEDLLAVSTATKCLFYDNSYHPHYKCQARSVDCFKCSKKGHFSKVCCSNKSPNYVRVNSVSAFLASIFNPTNSTETQSFFNKIYIDVTSLKALIDTCTTTSFISEDTISGLQLKVHPCSNVITMADNSTYKSVGYCIVALQLNDKHYEKGMLNVMTKLCARVILGRDFMSRHSSIEFGFSGTLPKLSFCSVDERKIEPPALFSNLSRVQASMYTLSQVFLRGSLFHKISSIKTSF